MAEPSRPRARDIYERVTEDAADELERPAVSLWYSALFAGFTIGLTPLVLALALAGFDGGGNEALAYLLYPVGYVAVILGRAQFFTENTLYPVMLCFRDRGALGPTARLWLIVFAANLVGAAALTVLLIESPAITEPVRDELTKLGIEASAGGFADNFWPAVVTGWILALVAWLVEATETAIAQIAAIWALILIVGLGTFDHCIASGIETLAATLDGEVGVGRLLGWLGTVTLGNIAGGVLIVSMLNYGQVRQP